MYIRAILTYAVKARAKISKTKRILRIVETRTLKATSLRNEK